MENSNKKTYVQPELTVHGDVEKVTQTTNTGRYADQVITQGQPITHSLS